MGAAWPVMRPRFGDRVQPLPWRAMLSHGSTDHPHHARVTDLGRARSFYEALGWSGAQQPDEQARLDPWATTARSRSDRQPRGLKHGVHETDAVLTRFDRDQLGAGGTEWKTQEGFVTGNGRAAARQADQSANVMSSSSIRSRAPMAMERCPSP